MPDNNEIFDSVLLGLAEKHPGGATDVSKFLFSFFYTYLCTHMEKWFSDTQFPI